DWYYLGAMAHRAKQYQTADSAWTAYIGRQPNIHQGYLYRARSRAAMDTAEVKSWMALDDYKEVIRKMKPEEQQRQKDDLEEAYNYMRLYFLYSADNMDHAPSKCLFGKSSEIDGGTSSNKQL